MIQQKAKFEFQRKCQSEK